MSYPTYLDLLARGDATARSDDPAALDSWRAELRAAARADRLRIRTLRRPGRAHVWLLDAPPLPADSPEARALTDRAFPPPP